MEEKKLTLSEFRKRVGNSTDVWRSLEELSRGDDFEDFVMAQATERIGFLRGGKKIGGVSSALHGRTG